MLQKAQTLTTEMLAITQPEAILGKPVDVDSPSKENGRVPVALPNNEDEKQRFS